MGTREQAIAYCKKEESRDPTSDGPKEFGHPDRVEDEKTQGRRTDIASVADALLDGASVSQVAMSHPSTYIKYHKGISALSNVIAESTPRRIATVIIILWGRTGTGKTRWVYAQHPSKEIYLKDPTTPWWDGYQGEPYVLFDDYVPGNVPIAKFLRWADRTPIKVEVKGAFVPFKARIIYITSNYDPAIWWAAAEEPNVEAFKRRVMMIKQFEDNWVPEELEEINQERRNNGEEEIDRTGQQHPLSPVIIDLLE